jgi:hypothetical protein
MRELRFEGEQVFANSENLRRKCFVKLRRMIAEGAPLRKNRGQI